MKNQIFLQVILFYIQVFSFDLSTQNLDMILLLIKQYNELCPTLCTNCDNKLIKTIDQPIYSMNNQFQNYIHGLKDQLVCVWIIFNEICHESEELFKIWTHLDMPLVIKFDESSKCLHQVPYISLKFKDYYQEYSVIGRYKSDERLLSFWKNKNIHQRISKVIHQWNIQPTLSMKGKELKVSVIGSPPFIRYKHNDILGADVQILKILAHVFDFRIKFHRETQWFKKDPESGKILGSIGSVYRNETQIGIGLISFTYERNLLIDHMTIIYELYFRLIFAKPRPLPPYLNILKPFSRESWMFFGISFGTVLLTIVITNLISPQEVLPWYSNLGYPIQLILHQDRVRLRLNNNSSKIVFFTFLVCSQFIVLAYQCNLRAYILSVDYSKPYNNLYDVYDNQLPIYIAQGTSYRAGFARSSIPIYKKSFEELHIRKNTAYKVTKGWFTEKAGQEIINNLAVGVEHSYFNLANYKRHVDQFGEQPFTMGTENIFTFPSSFVIGKKNPWKVSFDKCLLDLSSGGITLELIKNEFHPQAFLVEKSNNNKQPSSDILPFCLKHFALTYSLLGFGLIFSLIIFVFEYFVDEISDILFVVNYENTIEFIDTE